jgi:hypothetical protein
MIITPANTCTVSISAITIEKLTDATGDLTVGGNLTVRSPSYFNEGNTSYPGISFGLDTNTGFTKIGGDDTINISCGGTNSFKFGVVAFDVYSQTAAIRLGSSNDVILTRLAANSLALRNTTSAQTLSIYETYTDSSNFESYSMDAGVTTGDTFTIKANTLGSGADNLSIALTPAGTGTINLSSDVLIATSKVIKINALQVVGARVVDARIADTPNSGDGTTDGLIDAMRDAMIAHGLMAAA